MDNKKLVPQIRFKGFHDEWEEKKAEYIFITINDKNHIELPVLSATQEYGMVERCDSNYNISYNKNNLRTYKKVNKGQFVIHLRSFQGGFAHSNIIGITSPAYTIIDFKIKNNHNDKFWKYILSSEKFIKKLELVTYGIRDGRSINFNDFCILKFKFPVINEQKKISKLFENIDTLISKKQIKLEKVKALKQTLLKKMFPSENSDVPEIRFKGFTEKWEKKKFKYIFIFLKNNNFSRKLFIYNQGKVKNIHYGDILTIYNSYLDYKNEKIPYIKQDIKIVGDYLVNGDVVFADTAEDKTVGKCIEIGNIKGRIISGLHTLPCRANIKYAKYYLGYFLNSIYFHSQLVILMQGSKVSSLSKAAFLNTYIMYPFESEQEKIGNYFYKLDKLISLYEKEIEKLQKLKKAFFGKMFV